MTWVTTELGEALQALISSHDILLAHFPEPDRAWKWGLMGLACPLSAALKVFFLCDLEKRPKNLGKRPPDHLTFSALWEQWRLQEAMGRLKLVTVSTSSSQSVKPLGNQLASKGPTQVKMLILRVNYIFPRLKSLQGLKSQKKEGKDEERKHTVIRLHT